MFEDYSFLHTVKRSKGNRYGVVSGSVQFGYIPDRQRGRDFPVKDLRSELEHSLSLIRCSLSTILKIAGPAIELADGFTLVTGVGPKGYGNRIPTQQLIENLQEHPQMIRTLELCKVYVIVNGKSYNEGKPLALSEISPMEGATEPRVIPIPEILADPNSMPEQQVSTTDGGKLPQGSLTLRTSNVSMRWSKKGRHNIIYRARSGYIGYMPVSELDVQSPYRDRIYGECHLEFLEPFKQNERSRLANSPLTRAVEHFVSEQVQAYAAEFEARDRRRYDQEEKNALSKLNEALDRWKNRFLNEMMSGLWGRDGGGPPPPLPPLPSGRPARLELTLTHQKAGLGVSFRPTIKFFDQQARQIRPVPFRWISEDNNVAMVDEDLMVINTFSYGETAICAETMDRRMRSNKVPLEVVRIQDIRVVPGELEIPMGGRHKLEAICRLANREETGNVYLVWTESSPSVARVSAAGLVFGFALGETQVVAGDDNCLASPTTIRVVAGQDGGRGNKRGRGFPLVLVSGEIDPDPETKEFVHFSSEDPPVWQRPQDADRNIWWINSSSPLARLYLDSGKGYGYQTREWRMYHLERYIDVIVQIALTQGVQAEQPMSVNDWVMQWGSRVAEIQAAAAADLHDFIANGELPQGEG